MEDDLRWKMTFGGTQPFVENGGRIGLENKYEPSALLALAHPLHHPPLCGIFLSLAISALQFIFIILQLTFSHVHCLFYNCRKSTKHKKHIPINVVFQEILDKDSGTSTLYSLNIKCIQGLLEVLSKMI